MADVRSAEGVRAGNLVGALQGHIHTTTRPKSGYAHVHLDEWPPLNGHDPRTDRRERTAATTTNFNERPAAPAPTCRFCAAPLRHTFVDLGMSPLCESYVPAERVNAMEPFYPLHAQGLRELPARAARGVRHAGRGHLQRVRVLLVVLRLVGRARAQLRRDGGRALRARPRAASSWRSRATTATCCSTSSSAASRRSASSRPPTSPRSRRSTGSRRSCGSSAASWRRSLVAEGRRADLLAANNVMAHVPDLNDFVGGFEIAARARRRGRRSRCRTCCGSSRTTSSTRSTTSTSSTSRS